jgi:hypothetical protein
LKPHTIYNTSDQDLIVISCPTVKGGPAEEEQPTFVYGAPLQKFVFPAIPGMYNTQFKTLGRLAGLIAPVPSAIRVYQGLGIND